MRVFNFNKAVGFASSGVEYAQKYRRELLAGVDGVEDYYVFTDYLPSNIATFTSRLGFPNEQVIWLYHLLSGRRTTASSVTVEAFRETIQPHQVETDPAGNTVLRLSDSRAYYRVHGIDGFVDRVDTVLPLPDGTLSLATVSHYDATLADQVHFVAGQPVRRSFFTPDGRLAAEQHLVDRKAVQTQLTPASPLWAASANGRRLAYRGDVILNGRRELLQTVFAALVDRPDDVVVVDRALDMIDAVYPIISDRRLISVVHAEHYDLKQADDGVLLWNNHYEFVFTRPDLVDSIVVSTRGQQAKLREQLAGVGNHTEVVWIPVGYAEVAEALSYNPNALVTASRLASEKRLDLLVRAVALARETLPELTLDIYGEGQREPIVKAIDEVGAQEFVTLKGHQRLDGVLGGYGVYVTASTSEGFGLSLLEAMAQGLPIVGFDVEYGNREFVAGNGRLVPFSGKRGDDVAALAAAIVAVAGSPDLDAMRDESLRRAADYSSERVRAQWADLLLGGQEC